MLIFVTVAPLGVEETDRVAVVLEVVGVEDGVGDADGEGDEVDDGDDVVEAEGEVVVFEHTLLPKESVPVCVYPGLQTHSFEAESGVVPVPHDQTHLSSEVITW